MAGISHTMMVATLYDNDYIILEIKSIISSLTTDPSMKRTVYTCGDVKEISFDILDFVLFLEFLLFQFNILVISNFFD